MTTDLPAGWDLIEEHEMAVDLAYNRQSMEINGVVKTDPGMFVNIKWDGCINLWNEDRDSQVMLHICDIKQFSDDVVKIYRMYFTEGYL